MQLDTGALLGPLDRVAVAVTGNDRATYLDAVLTQRLRDVTPGTATAALELGPHGEPTGVLELAVLDDRFVLLVSEAQRDEVLARLTGRTFLAEVTFDELDAETRRLRGSDAHAVLAAAGLPTEPGSVSEHDRVLVLVWRHGADLVGPTDALDALAERLVASGAGTADADALDAAEIAAGVPRAPEEITRGRLPEELGLLPTHVHLAKGCYPGQEAVARMWMLGRPRRRLAVVRLADGLDAGEHGERRSKVVVTRTATIDGTHVGLALVPADTSPGDEPHDGVEVLSLVGADLPVPGHDPAVTRRRDR